MSATKRGAVRRESDNYATPFWCVRRLQEVVSLPGGYWLEPCAGDGAIISALKPTSRADVTWTACEIRPVCEKDLLKLVPNVVIGDFLRMQETGIFDVCITNPPYSLARQFIEKCLRLCKTTIMLLRLNFLGSSGDRRHLLIGGHRPDVYVLPNRPSFTGGSRTDATEYGWFVWSPASSGRWQLLADTPVKERHTDSPKREHA